MQEFKSQRIKTVIKDLLKKKGLTYEELAEQMECSIPTIKRILGPEELTLNRLLQLCEIVDIDLADLEAMTTEVQSEVERYNEEQQLFLSKNKPFLAYLMKLFEGKTPKQIADEHGLNQRSTDKYLIGLEKHELIRVTGKQKVKTAFKGVPTLGNGILSKVYFESIVRNSATFFIDVIHESLQKNLKDEKGKPACTFAMQASKISRASYQNWVKEKEKLMHELIRIATYEEKTLPPSQLETMVVMSAYTLVENDYHGLKVVNNTFGDIPNL